MHDAWADNLPVNYFDRPATGRKNKAYHFFESFLATMGCHIQGYKGTCIWAHNIILWISVHGMIVAKSAQMETTVQYIY